MNTGIEPKPSRSSTPPRWVLAICVLAVFFMGVGATKAFMWNSYSPPKDAAPTWWKGDERERLRAMTFGSDFSVEYLQMAITKLENGTERERTQAELGIQRLRKHLPK